MILLPLLALLHARNALAALLLLLTLLPLLSSRSSAIPTWEGRRSTAVDGRYPAVLLVVLLLMLELLLLLRWRGWVAHRTWNWTGTGRAHVRSRTVRVVEGCSHRLLFGHLARDHDGFTLTC